MCWRWRWLLCLEASEDAVLAGLAGGGEGQDPLGHAGPRSLPPLELPQGPFYDEVTPWPGEEERHCRELRPSLLIKNSEYRTLRYTKVTVAN